MESPLRVFSGACPPGYPAGSPASYPPGHPASYSASYPASYIEKLREECRLAQSARVNLLVVHSEGDPRNLLEWLKLDLQEPTVTWRAGERLVLPPVAWARTMILQDVGALGDTDQLSLLDWLERAAGRTQVVSTTSAPLWPRIQAGAFIDSLYYRLNTVCVDVAASVADAPGAIRPSRSTPSRSTLSRSTLSRLRAVRFTGSPSGQ
jgi:hypothetical protein